MAELIATPAARDAVIGRLKEHFARNDLDTAGFETRVEQAERAATQRELDQAVAGLPPLDNVALQKTAPAAVERVADAAAPGAIIRATLSAVTRGGRWVLPEQVQVHAFLGAVDLDLSDAEVPAAGTVVDCRATAGSITIVVDGDVDVSCEGNALLGSFSAIHHDHAGGRPRRRLRIVGRALLGSVDVVVKKRVGALEQVGARLDQGIRGLLGK